MYSWSVNKIVAQEFSRFVEKLSLKQKQKTLVCKNNTFLVSLGIWKIQLVADIDIKSLYNQEFVAKINLTKYAKNIIVQRRFCEEPIARRRCNNIVIVIFIWP